MSPADRPQPAKADDLAGIRVLLESCQLPAADLTAEGLQHFLVLRDAAQVGGLAGVAGLEVHGQDGLLRSVAIASARRNEGLGRLLVSAVESQARTFKLKALYLLTTTAADYFARPGTPGNSGQH